MEVRSIVSARRLLLAVLAAGLGGFVLLHTALLFSDDQPIAIAFRRAWVAGLLFVAALGIFLSVVGTGSIAE